MNPIEYASLLGSPVFETLCTYDDAALDEFCAGELAPDVKEWKPEPVVDPDYSGGLGGGGWGDEIATSYETAACDIDRRSSLTADEFEREYVNKFKPVMIGAGAFEGDWPAADGWSREGLLEEYGDIKVSVGSIPYERDFRTTAADAVRSPTNPPLPSPSLFFDRV